MKTPDMVVSPGLPGGIGMSGFVEGNGRRSIARADDPYVRAREGSYYFRACEEPFPPRPSLAPRNSLAKGLSEFTDHPIPLLCQAPALQAELHRCMQYCANDLDLRVQHRRVTIERVNLKQRLAIIQAHAEQPLQPPVNRQLVPLVPRYQLASQVRSLLCLPLRTRA